MKLLGLSNLEPYSWYTHDTSAALIEDQKIIFATAEERFTRVKHYSGFPACSIDWISKHFDTSFNEITIAIPWAQKKTGSDIVLTNNDVPIISRLHLFKRSKTPTNVIFIDHQLAHVASAYRTSGLKDSLLISLDGGGSDSEGPTSGGIFYGKNYKIEKISAFPLEHNFGNFFGAVTEALGWAYGDGEGKTMGLASYGNAECVYDKLEKLAPSFNGSNLVDGKYTPPKFEIINGRFCVEFTDTIFSFLKELIHKYGAQNVASAAQRILEDRIEELLLNAVDTYGCKKICLGGGVFLNVKVNKMIRELISDCEISLHSNPGDGGSAVGCALEAEFILTGKCATEKIDSSFFGTSYNNDEIKCALNFFEDKLSYYKSDDVCGDAAHMIAHKQVIGWYQGKSEWGPRALGARCVLADPSDNSVKDRINNLLKQRESFMPFAPSIKEETIGEYLINPIASPFMLFAFDVVDSKKREIPAVVHVDGTARAQTVNKNSNPLYYKLISEFEKESGLPLVLNTSFNRHGLPLVNSPVDAIQHLLWGCIDSLVIGDFIVKKKG